MQEPRKSTLLFVQDAAAEPAALGAFAAEQPALALVTADGLDEAERKLAQLDPALVVWQCDAPGMQEKTDQLQSQLQDMKRIHKAKSLLMNQLGMSEADAHRWIEKAAMDRCVKKREIAETIIRMYAL